MYDPRIYKLFYIQLNKKIKIWNEDGTGELPFTVTFDVVKITDKAYGLREKSYGMHEGKTIWIPRSQLLCVGKKALCFDSRWLYFKLVDEMISEDLISEVEVKGEFGSDEERDAKVLALARRIANRGK